MTSQHEGFTIPKKEWWCGCKFPEKHFKTEKQFLSHLFRVHTSSYDNILNDIRKRNQ